MKDLREEFKNNLKDFIMGIENMKKEEVLEITNQIIKDSDLTEEEKKEIKELTNKMLENKD